MSLWQAIVLGIVQGATEFLPVSSSGHLVMAEHLMGLELPGVFFEVAVHVATLVSILLVYRERVTRLASGAVRGERDAWRYVGLLLLASIPAGVVGVLFEDRIGALFDDPAVPGWALLVTGLVLWSSRAALARDPREEPTPPSAAAMGIAQAFALVPGISRSGSTVVTGLWLGVDAREAAAFSFLMFVPAITGAALLQLPELADGDPGMGWGALAAAAVAAAVTGVLAIRTFNAMLRNRSFHAFAWYCWLAGAGYLLYLRFAG